MASVRTAFRPVLVGLNGAYWNVHEQVLQNFFIPCCQRAV